MNIELFSKVLFKIVISYYRILIEIVLDRDKLFISKF